ncbi:membrane protein [Actinorhabdospora filicis]|uniref:Membrane protein n=1 Tax=Actinorhabdospora filicis TaxID=1785913 RepID=A0A9W6SK93_9ACTN|nr:DUF4267 domain-containing protein [Actinorhabdospora filicis]GLZ77236.1 membrane protein [Actinorhabdospora filicis]
MSVITTPKNRPLAIASHIAAGLGALFILYIGISYLFFPESTAPTFGLASWPEGDGEGFLRLKGARDIASGLIFLTLLATRQTRALGWVYIASSFIPFTDAAVVLSHGGSVAAALFIHTLTALFVLATGVVIAINEKPRKVSDQVAATPAKIPAATSA